MKKYFNIIKSPKNLSASVSMFEDEVKQNIINFRSDFYLIRNNLKSNKIQTSLYQFWYSGLTAILLQFISKKWKQQII